MSVSSSFFSPYVSSGLYNSSSFSALTVGLGSKTVTVSSGLDYRTSDRVHVASTANPTAFWLEGVVTSYLGNTLVFTADRYKGAGVTLSSWTVDKIEGTTSSGPNGYDVIVIAGQSNAVGWNSGDYDALIDFTSSRICQWGCSTAYMDKLLMAKDPLQWPPNQTPFSTSVGCAMTFAKQYIASTDRDVLLVPAAVGATRLYGGPWSVGGDLYNNLIARTNAAIAYGGGNNQLKCIIWIQGEADVQSSVSQTQYANAFDPMLDGFRSSITGGTNCPMVVVSMVPEWMAANSTYSAPIYAAHVDTPNRKYYTAFVDGPTGAAVGGGANIHYSGAGQRAIGLLAFSAYQNALLNTPTRVKKPTISLASGSFYSTQTVTLASATPSAIIYYTTDGSIPTTTSSIYTLPLSISTSVTLRVFAFKIGMDNSDISSATYTIFTRVDPVTLSVSAGTYTSTQTVTLGCITPGSQIFYTTDGFNPTSGSSLYSSPLSIAATTTLKAIGIRSGLTDGPITSATYIIQVATPTISLAGGAYVGTQSITLSCDTSGVEMFYTTDGSTPATSQTGVTTRYTGAFNISTSMTLKVIATKTGLSNSAIASATYTFPTQTATPTFSPVAGTYVGTQSVTISCSTSGAQIFYTTDGSTPATSQTGVTTEYTAAISVASTSTIKAIATKSGLSDSPVSSALYTITEPVYSNIVSYPSADAYSGATYTFRNRFKASSMTIPSGTVTRFKVQAIGNIRKMYIGIALDSGSNSNTSSMTQVTFNNGATSITGQPGTTRTLSDPIILSWNKTSDIIVSVYFLNTDATGLKAAITGCDAYYAAGSDVAANTNPGTVGVFANRFVSVDRIQSDGF